MNNFSSKYFIKMSGITNERHLVINSWKKAIRNLILMMIPGFIISALVLYNFLPSVTEVNSNILPIFLVGILFSIVANGLSLYFRVYKMRLEFDSYGITIHLGKDNYYIHKDDITKISISSEKRSTFTKPADYYKILFSSQNEFPFDDILVEKAPQVQEDIDRYYRNILGVN